MAGTLWQQLRKLGEVYEAGETDEELDDFTDQAMDIIWASHEIRDLQWKVKNLGKSNGKQGTRIYELRCMLAEARKLILVDPTYQRGLEERYTAALKRINDQNEEIRTLQTRIIDLEKEEEMTMTEAVATAYRNFVEPSKVPGLA